MRSLKSRISKIESTSDELPHAWVAMIHQGGTVSLSHVEHGNFRFSSMEEFARFRATKGIKESDYLLIEIVSPKPEK